MLLNMASLLLLLLFSAISPFRIRCFRRRRFELFPPACCSIKKLAAAVVVEEEEVSFSTTAEELWKSDDTIDALPLFPLWDECECEEDKENDDARGTTRNAKQIVPRMKAVTRVLKDAGPVVVAVVVVDLDVGVESERDDAEDAASAIINNTVAVVVADVVVDKMYRIIQLPDKQ